MLKVEAEIAAFLFCPVPTIWLPSIYPLCTHYIPFVYTVCSTAVRTSDLLNLRKGCLWRCVRQGPKACSFHILINYFLSWYRTLHGQFFVGGTEIFFFFLKKFSLQMKEILSALIKNAVVSILKYMFCLLKSYVLLSAVKELCVWTIILSMHECTIESLYVFNDSKWIILLRLLGFLTQYTIGCAYLNFEVGC